MSSYLDFHIVETTRAADLKSHQPVYLLLPVLPCYRGVEALVRAKSHQPVLAVAAVREVLLALGRRRPRLVAGRTHQRIQQRASVFHSMGREGVDGAYLRRARRKTRISFYYLFVLE